MSGAASEPGLSLPGKRLRAVSEHRTRNESQRLREKRREGNSGYRYSREKTENPVPRCSFVIRDLKQWTTTTTVKTSVKK